MNIRLIIALCVFGLVLSCGSRSENKATEESTLLRVAAYNVEVSRSATAQEIGRALKSYNLDVVCFSEAPGGDWTESVAREMGLDHVVVGRYSTAGHDDKFKSIASRTPLYGYEEFLMTDTLHTVTKALTKVGDKEVAIYSLHFPFGWRDQAHIDETTAKITSFVDYLRERQQEEITLALGDFNFIPSSEEAPSEYYELFSEIGLEFSWKDLNINPAQHNTHNAFEPEDEGNGNVIDHILYNPEKVVALDGHIIEMDPPLSDHKPVWALLQIK